MFRKIPIAFLLIYTTTSSAQTATLGDFGKRMYFHLFTDSAHPVVYDFAKSYSSVLVESPDTSAQWTVSYEANPKPDTLTYSKHSLFIPKHPYFDAEYLYCTFEITMKKSKHYSPSIYDLYLSFTFDSKQKAIAAFEKLSFILDGYGTKKETSNNFGLLFAKYYYAADSLLYDQVQFALVNDQFNKNLYHLYFSKWINLFNTDRTIYQFWFNVPE